MNSSNQLMLYGLAVALTLAPPVLAEPPAHNGRVLLLDNGRALEGEIHEENGSYSVRRATGEMRLTSDKVLALCATWEEAFAVMRGRANLRDPDEHLRLARWCQTYGLRAQALAEATASLQMRPAHAESRQLITLLQRTAPPSTLPPAAPRQTVQASVPAAPAIDLSVEAFAAFTARVQPVLMNTCASCHAGSGVTKFRMLRPSGNSLASRRATQQNMTAALAFIDPAHPGASPLLLKAVTDHGKSGEAPLKAQSPPYRILNEWIELTLATNPFLREQRMPLAQATPPTPVETKPPVPIARTLPVSSSPVEPRSEPALVISQATTVTAPPRTPPPCSPAAATAAPVDDFDPTAFNRRFHQPSGAGN
jgi:hypothetical protein